MDPHPLDGLPLDADQPLLVQVSRFDPWKDPLGVVDVYRQVADAVSDVQIALVGAMPSDDPEGRAVFETVADRTATDTDVHLLTNQPDLTINALQRQADVVLQKSRREGFALTVAESLWKRTPVVASDVGGIPLQIDHGSNGYLVDPSNITAAAGYCTDLLENDQLRIRLGENGHRTVAERFLLPRLLADFFSLYRDLLDR